MAVWKSCIILIVVLVSLASGAPTKDDGPVMLPRAYVPLKIGSVTPKGWLLQQLKLQADGLSGHLSQFWNDIQNSIWIGGQGDGGLHERAPYWLNGIVPLAYLLKNAGVDDKASYAGIYKTNKENAHVNVSDPVSISDQANKYIQYILSHQQADGWLGPANDNMKDGNIYWGRSNVMLSLAQYAEAEPSHFNNVTQVMINYAMLLKTKLGDTKLSGWAAARWMDIALGIEWLLLNAPQGKETELVELIHMLHDQGSDWEGWFETFTGNAGPHNVNNAQALKSAAVYYLMNGNESLHTLSKTRMQHLDQSYGLPTGMFNGDELLPMPATRNPSRGIELCGVVEAMFSYNTMFSVHGDVEFADRAERIAFNALPATWASPTGGDMWAHQYLQAVNEINAESSSSHVWTHDGGDAENYGLEPNYGCCTANFNQGWPKFASMLVYSTSDNGAAVAIFAPSTSVLPDGSTVDIDTAYPFEDHVRITVIAKAPMPLYIRIPGWATNATINGNAAANGTMSKQSCRAGENKFTINFAPEIRVERWGDSPSSPGGPVSVHRGPLMFSLPITPNYTVYAHHYGGPNDSNDYMLHPTSEWRYAIDVDETDPSKTLEFNATPYITGLAPFNHTAWPVTISATVRLLPNWGMTLNSASEPPSSPACSPHGANQCGSPVKVTLVPHGGTELRIGELPQSGF